MKILHALVGYLAVAALPFHPFALTFASPLAAIDNDGQYVNTIQNHIDVALMKHVLDSIVDTCQTVTTQNHKDCALMERVPGNVIEARQWEVIPIAALIVITVNGIIISLIFIEGDNPVINKLKFLVQHFDQKSSGQKRAEFTHNTISKMTSQYPKWNWVICHSPYNVGFDGVEGKDWGYTHHELKISFGRTIGSVLLTYLQYFVFFSFLITF